MKKSIKKLNLNKRTISNLDMSQMNMRLGGEPTNGNGNTCQCPTVYTCYPTVTCYLCTWYCGDGGGGGYTKGKKDTCNGCAQTL